MQGELLTVDVNADELASLRLEESFSPSFLQLPLKQEHQDLNFTASHSQRTVGAKFKPQHEAESDVEPPPMCAQSNDFKTLREDFCFHNSSLNPSHSLSHSRSQSTDVIVQIVEHPPLEVRTRTKNENRTFSCSAEVRVKEEGVEAKVSLCYAKDPATVLPILGGTLTRKVARDGRVVFDDLSVSVASPKHGEKEFALCIAVPAGDRTWRVYSRPFYAYSHKSVLKRRRELRIKALSTAAASTQGGTKMHVVGSPFIRSERLQVVFRVLLADYKRYCAAEVEQLELSESGGEWVSIAAEAVDYFSDSVLFFETPNKLQRCTDDVINVFVQVTNDGRNFSNPLPFTLYGNQLDDSDASPSKKLRLLSRM